MTASVLDRDRRRSRQRTESRRRCRGRRAQLERPLELEEVAVPIAGPDEVVVRVEASGLCHTDIHAAHGDWPSNRRRRSRQGTKAWASSSRWDPGSPRWLSVTVSPFHGSATPAGPASTASADGRRSARAAEHGYSLDGTFADYAKSYGRYAAKVPAGVDPIDAGPLTCAGVTTYKAVKVAGTRSSDLVAVFGVGGLGHLAIQYAAIAGGQSRCRRGRREAPMARELGADFTVNAAEQDPAEAMKAKLGGADVAVALAASAQQSFDQAYRSLRRGGRLVCVALPADNAKFQPADLRHRSQRQDGHRLDRRHSQRHLADVFALHAAGKTRVIRETRSLNEVNEAIADVEAGRVPARIVFTPDSTSPQAS